MNDIGDCIMNTIGMSCAIMRKIVQQGCPHDGTSFSTIAWEKETNAIVVCTTMTSLTFADDINTITTDEEETD